MVITRDDKDVWEEVRQKADKCRESNTPIYTLAENVPNQIIKVEPDKIWRQSRDPISKNGGPSPVSRTEIERIWNAIRQNGEAIEERNVTALRFAWRWSRTSLKDSNFAPARFAWSSSTRN